MKGSDSLRNPSMAPDFPNQRQFLEGTKWNEMPEITAETSKVSGSVTVWWSAGKQMNDIWRAFSEIDYLFKSWRIDKEAAKRPIRAMAKEQKGFHGRYYAMVPGYIVLRDDGTYEAFAAM